MIQYLAAQLRYDLVIIKTSVYLIDFETTMILLNYAVTIIDDVSFEKYFRPGDR